MSSDGRSEPTEVAQRCSSPVPPAVAAAELGRLVSERLAALRARIARLASAPENVSVVAVTKGFGPVAVQAALAAGLTAIGENYAGELLDKATLLDGPHGVRSAISWHFLGAIQRNKIARLAGVVDCWQSVTRVVEVDSIMRAAGDRARELQLLVEVESTGLHGRRGVVPSDVPRLVAELSSRDVAVAGLMTVAPPGGGGEAVAAFRVTTQLADDLGLQQRSMGMSDDLDEALEAGSTMLRIGRGLFGARPRPDGLSQ